MATTTQQQHNNNTTTTQQQHNTTTTQQHNNTQHTPHTTRHNTHTTRCPTMRPFPGGQHLRRFLVFGTAVVAAGGFLLVLFLPSVFQTDIRP
jgi:hypothetical protein